MGVGKKKASTDVESSTSAQRVGAGNLDLKSNILVTNNAFQQRAAQQLTRDWQLVDKFVARLKSRIIHCNDSELLKAMSTEKTNGESTPPAITSLSPATRGASSLRKFSPIGSPLTIVPSVLQRSRT